MILQRRNWFVSVIGFIISEKTAHSVEKCLSSANGFTAGSIHPVERAQSFRIITTRQFYPGGLKLSIIVNGEEKAHGDFLLTDTRACQID